MHVTVITDASHCPETDVGGYGYWIVCDRGKRPGSGVLAGPIGNSVCAEVGAVCMTLYEGLRHGLIQDGDLVLVQTDCTGAIDCLEGRGQPSSNLYCSAARTYFADLVKRHNLIVNFRHVKGHTNIREPRYAANRACDARAKQAMREARDAKRKSNG